MLACNFVLNGKMHTNLSCKFGNFVAFSGKGEHRNNPVSGDKPDRGPLPMGLYYIVDRLKSGGFRGMFEEASGKNKWFALHRLDDDVNDETFIGRVRRGEFRLHMGERSAGCITLEYPTQFILLRSFLLSEPEDYVPHTKTRTYGTVFVGL